MAQRDSSYNFHVKVPRTAQPFASHGPEPDARVQAVQEVFRVVVGQLDHHQPTSYPDFHPGGQHLHRLRPASGVQTTGELHHVGVQASAVRAKAKVKESTANIKANFLRKCKKVFFHALHLLGINVCKPNRIVLTPDKAR